MTQREARVRAVRVGLRLPQVEVDAAREHPAQDEVHHRRAGCDRASANGAPSSARNTCDCAAPGTSTSTTRRCPLPADGACADRRAHRGSALPRAETRLEQRVELVGGHVARDDDGRRSRLRRRARHACSISARVSFSTSAALPAKAVPVGVPPAEDRGGERVLLHRRAGLFFSCWMDASQRLRARSISASGKVGLQHDVGEHVERGAEPRGEHLHARGARVPVAPRRRARRRAPRSRRRSRARSRVPAPCSSMPPMKATAPGRAPATSPAPTPVTTRTLTMGRSWRSTKSTRTPFFIVHESMRGGVHATAGPGGGGLSRNGASGVTRGGSGGAGGAGHEATGGGDGGGGGRGGCAAHPASATRAASDERTAQRSWRPPHEAPGERRALDRAHDGRRPVCPAAARCAPRLARSPPSRPRSARCPSAGSPGRRCSARTSRGGRPARSTLSRPNASCARNAVRARPSSAAVDAAVADLRQLLIDGREQLLGRVPGLGGRDDLEASSRAAATPGAPRTSCAIWSS